MRRSLRVMLDARMFIGRFSGVSRVVTRLAEELARQGGVEVVALCGDTGCAPWPDRPGIKIVRSSFSRPDRRPLRRVLWDQTRLRSVIAAAGVDLFHATWNFGVPPFCPVPAVLTIHDLIPWSTANGNRRASVHRACYRYAVRASARRASWITTVSDTVRCEVIDRLHASPDRVVTIPNGVDMPVGEPGDAQRTASAYALYVGGCERRKNLAGVFRAMKAYWRRYDRTLELRLTGNAKALSLDDAAEYRNLPQDAPVRFLGTVSDAELTRQYASARVLLLLSHHEGFGLPALEAMAHGCPVIAADRPALPEVVGDAGLLVDPDDPDEAADAIHSLISDAARRDEAVRRGLKRARASGWDLFASRMRAVYESALLGKPLPRMAASYPPRRVTCSP